MARVGQGAARDLQGPAGRGVCLEDGDSLWAFVYRDLLSPDGCSQQESVCKFLLET